TERAVHEAPPRRRPPTKVILPLAALLIAALLVAQWATTGARRGSGPFAGAFLEPGAALAMAMPAQEQPLPQQPAQPPQTPLDSIAPRLADPVAPMVTEAMMRERETRAAAAAFPVRERVEMSSTMYCLRGEMRTGVRTRDGMAAGDPRVLPLG